MGERDISQPIVLPNGAKEWRNAAGQLHRDSDKPAVERADGTELWYKDGKCHRDGDRPAIEWANGAKSWYKDGKLHRDGDKPAVEYVSGGKSWHKDDKEYYFLRPRQKYVPLFDKHIIPWVDLGNYIGPCRLLTYFPGEDKYFAQLPVENDQYFVSQIDFGNVG